MNGATAGLPDFGAVLDAATNAQSGLGNFLKVAGSLASGGPDSPLRAVNQAIGGMQGALSIDLSGLAQGLPQAIDTIGHALPDDTLQFVEDLEAAYQGLSDFLAHNELVRQIHPGDSLEKTALALIEAALGEFGHRLAALGSSLIDTATLSRITQALTALEQMAAGHPPAAGELVEFLAQQLVGVGHDLLDGARSQLDGALMFAQPLSAAALEARIGGARDAAATAFKALATAVRDFDAADAAAYAALGTLLDAWTAAVDAGFAAVETGCSALTALVAQPAWDGLFGAYATALAAIPLADVPTIDDAVDAMAGMLDELLAKLAMSLSPQDLAAQVARFSASIHDLFAQSALAQVRQILIDFIGRIQSAIESIPTDKVQQAVSAMLQRVHEVLDGLGISQVRSTIEQGFETAHDFIDQTLGTDLLGGLQVELTQALQQFEAIPIDELAQALTDAIAQVGTLIEQLEASMASALDELKDLLAQLDGLDFAPLADPVVDEIGALKSKLAAIKPESISDAEKIALQAGLAVLRAIDLESMIEDELKKGFKAIDDELSHLVQAALDAWLEFRRRVGGFDGAALAAPVTALLDDVTHAVQGVNGQLVLAPLDKLVDALVAQAQALSPGALLDPLKAPYQQMMQAINRANPDVWVQPLRALHTEIDRLIALIDITPLLDTLEAKERELFKQARDALAAALDALHLPPPLDAFLDSMKALVLGLADAVFGDPDTSLRQFNLTLAGSVKPSTLFKPLDAAFDRLLAAIEGTPADVLLAALETLRTGLGTAWPALNPALVVAALREAQARLALLSPAALAGVGTLPALRASLVVRFDANPGNDAAKAALLARFDVALAPLAVGVDGSRLARLQAAQQALVDALRQRINGLDASGALAAYRRVDAQLARLLPAFLRQPNPLTLDDLRAGLATLRPSTKARRIDAAVDRFLAELKPLQSALDGSVNGFFQEIRNAALVLHPAGLKDAVSGVYTTLRSKLHVLDPDALAAELRTAVWDPLIDPLKAIDPAAIQVQLDALYHDLVDKLSTGVRGLIKPLKDAIDSFLNKVRAALSKVLAKFKQQLEDILQGVGELLDKLDKLIVDDLFKRLLTLLANLEKSFDQQLDRVRNEFDAMLAAIPLGESSAAVAV